ncbi:monosaccharide ABC transporter ATP-binding protein (CUT2 family) [Shimia isoporae]|uniref:Monosaccharide ABC transporter ATP-binding protein (CUT2 family) n=1 Tax=Shimia isoporae TaxID=647720 RepID=A0A4V2Q496_9RHOB|nr:sugar ABC transporter ATP-binding protein [Shimia isoporae]TCL10300.1 monosaccharide ABC transporter ATP-binding protein (CUT2 family) [Shimia isoporae]
MTLALSNISKSFPGVKALDDVSITFEPGHVHALLGENGAGKSTLIKAICGIHKPDQGSVSLDGKKLSLGSLKEGMAAGITIVNQEIQVFSESSIAENIMMDKLEIYRKRGGLDWAQMNRDAAQYLARVGLHLDPELPIGGLSAAQKQLVQIAKALSREAQVILLDEPTSSITANEVAKLFELIHELRDKGITMIFVSHKLEEVLEICDMVSVLRDGRHVGTRPIAEMDKEKIIEMMIGRRIQLENFGALTADDTVIALRANGVTSDGLIEDASFDLRKGEILGFYGLVGAGRSELAKTIIGHYPKTRGKLFKDGLEIHAKSVGESIRKNSIGYVSENRKEEGLFLDFDIETNMTITIWKRLRNAISRKIDPRRQREMADGMMDALDVRATGVDQLVGNLSGGNQQKISIAKWLAADCDILIIDEPSVGVDVGAKSTIHKIIWDLANEQGKSIILISSDMPEMISLATRILVFKEKRITGEVDGIATSGLPYEDVSREIGRLMA